MGDAWNNSKIRQKPILDELGEFSEWYETGYKKYCDENNIPVEERTKLGMIETIEEAKVQENNRFEAMGIPMGNLSE